MSTCRTEDCPKAPSEDHRGIRFLARNLLGSAGGRLLEGYCSECGRKNVWHGWLILVAVICVFIGIAGLPGWKPAAVAALVFGFWFGLYRMG